ncbi:spermidine synthase [Cohnella cellulosilytica]|uniref:Spermidine synthase n=1 Tax=Cohnella cellulosilytica TaxID=986710 RepID=A0ABW2FHU1_9BACL
MAEVTSPYNEIAVYETAQLDGEAGRFRCMRFADEDVQGAIDLRDSRRLVLGYQKALARLLELRDPSFGSLFVIGHGCGSIPRYYSGKAVKVAEIDAAVVELSRRYFGYADHNVAIGDGRALLEAEPDGAFDYIVLDAFTSKGTPAHLTTEAFFRLASDKLSPGGALVLNVMGRPRDDGLTEAIGTTLRRVFADTRCYSLPAKRNRDRRNMIFIGSDAEFELGGRGMGELVEVELAEGYVLLDDPTPRA